MLRPGTRHETSRPFGPTSRAPGRCILLRCMFIAFRTIGDGLTRYKSSNFPRYRQTYRKILSTNFEHSPPRFSDVRTRRPDDQ